MDTILEATIDGYEVQVRDGEDGWLVAEMPQMHGCVTQAHSVTELLSNIRDAVKSWIDAGGKPSHQGT